MKDSFQNTGNITGNDYHLYMVQKWTEFRCRKSTLTEFFPALLDDVLAVLEHLRCLCRDEYFVVNEIECRSFAVPLHENFRPSLHQEVKKMEETRLKVMRPAEEPHT